MCVQVTDIVVCGHYGCGGVRAAMENVDHGLLEHWLLNIRNVQRLHLDVLKVTQGLPKMRDGRLIFGRRVVDGRAEASETFVVRLELSGWAVRRRMERILLFKRCFRAFKQ